MAPGGRRPDIEGACVSFSWGVSGKSCWLYNAQCVPEVQSAFNSYTGCAVAAPTTAPTTSPGTDAPTASPCAMISAVRVTNPDGPVHGHAHADWLHLSEIEVYVGGTNVAPRGTASAMSAEIDNPVSRLNDGITDPSIFHHSASDDSNEWVGVTLATPAVVSRVVVYARGRNSDGTDCCELRSADLAVQLLDVAGIAVANYTADASRSPDYRAVLDVCALPTASPISSQVDCPIGETLTPAAITSSVRGGWGRFGGWHHHARCGGPCNGSFAFDGETHRQSVMEANSPDGAAVEVTADLGSPVPLSRIRFYPTWKGVTNSRFQGRFAAWAPWWV
eukprot:gene58254-biopygen82925